jgi:hypothetical protein
MSLPYYQDCVTRYFRQGFHRFIDFLARSQTPSILEPDEIYQQILMFLEEELRRDLTLYEKYTRGYDYIIDMLIEVKTMNHENVKSIIMNDFSVGFRHC